MRWTGCLLVLQYFFSQSFFPIVDIMFHCRDMFGLSSEWVPKSVFCHPARVGKCPREFGPNFSNSSHKWICVQVWLRSIQWPQRLGVEKKRRKKENHSDAMQANKCKSCGFLQRFDMVDRKASSQEKNRATYPPKVLCLNNKTEWTNVPVVAMV